eukprot:Nitzschia sp. Nitz4//scaffold32_size149145//91333//93333//NITZ4_002888-RA/size149145-processed-gene-0.129-mRNA-1//-1//CDS//3329548096//6998//frame0
MAKDEVSSDTPSQQRSLYSSLLHRRVNKNNQQSSDSQHKRQRRLGGSRRNNNDNNTSKGSSSATNGTTQQGHAGNSEDVAILAPLDLSSSSVKSRRRLNLNLFKRGSGSTSTLRGGSASNKGSFTEESDMDEHRQSVMDRTRIVTQAVQPSPSASSAVEAPPTPVEEENFNGERTYDCATAILGHTYLETLCGLPTTNSFDHAQLPYTPHTQRRLISEDPSVQESIECIFASQLENGLDMWADDEPHSQLQSVESRDDQTDPHLMLSPSNIQQSRQIRSKPLLSTTHKKCDQANLVYFGTFDPAMSGADNANENSKLALSCPCGQSALPSLEPSQWPQAPILLRPTPGRGTRIKGVRFSGSNEYLWEPNSDSSWADALKQKWGKDSPPSPWAHCCEACATLPINNGNEPEGEALIVDFESDLFEGSLLLRIRFTNGTTPQEYDDNKGYFQGMNRRYQAVVRGKFKQDVPFTELSTGFKFERPCGKLPAKWILRGGIKVLSFFAPQLDAKMEGDKPHSLTPLGSTPQAITVDDATHEQELPSLELSQEEAMQGHRTLLGEVSVAPTSLQRAKARKKAFDKLFVQKSKVPKADPSKLYTFEFLQHLFNFQDYSIELGSMLGSVELQDILDGQPLQFMAAHGDQALWSFDLWHESLWERAKHFDQLRPS